MSKTPLLVYTDTNFKDYIKSLDRPAKKNYRYVKKNNTDLEYKEIGMKIELIEEFMDLWEEQTIHGDEQVRWAFGIEYIIHLHNLGNLRVFAAYKGDKPYAVHFIEKHDEYVECHPPMYDKAHNQRYLGKYMWFNLIEWACKTDVKFLDLGGGERGTWKELIKDRALHPRIAYKWAYVPQWIKESENQPDYLIHVENGKKYLKE